MKLFKFLLVIGSFLLLFNCTNKVDISQWKGPNRDGYYPAENLLKQWPDDGPELLWKNDEIGLGHSSAAVTSDKVYVSGTIDSTTYIFTFDHEGNLLWKKPLGFDWVRSFPGVRSTPLIFGDKGYLFSGKGVLYCFSSETGDIIWSEDMFEKYGGVNILHGVTENLLIDDNKLYCAPGGKEHNIVALDPNTGDLIWSSEGNGDESAYGSPIIINHYGKKYLIMLMANAALSIDAENGEVMWKYDFTYEWKVHANTPVYHNGDLFIVDGFESGNCKLNLAEDGRSYEVAWKDTLLEDTFGDYILMDGRLYGAVRYYDDSWVCLDWETGEKIYALSTWGPGSIISADGMLYCFGFNGEFGLVKPTEEGFELVSKFQVESKRPDHWAFPVIFDGKLFVRYTNSLLVYDIAEK